MLHSFTYSYAYFPDRRIIEVSYNYKGLLSISLIHQTIQSYNHYTLILYLDLDGGLESPPPFIESIVLNDEDIAKITPLTQIIKIISDSSLSNDSKRELIKYAWRCIIGLIGHNNERQTNASPNSETNHLQQAPIENKEEEKSANNQTK